MKGFAKNAKKEGFKFKPHTYIKLSEGVTES